MLPRRNRAADLARMHTAQLGYYGEPVTLQDGRTLVAVPRAGWDPVVLSPAGDRKTPLELRYQDRPQVLVATVDAVGLRERDPVTWRAERYFIARLDPDGDLPEAGLTRLELMRADGRTDETEQAVWR